MERLPSSEIIAVKGLALITPEKASQLGLSAEGPVFVSRSTLGFEKCRSGHAYSALVYQSGSVVEAQHFHQDDKYGDGGGIYFEFSNDDDPEPTRAFYGWSAQLRPLGDVSTSFGFCPSGRSQAAHVVGISANCARRDHGEVLADGYAAFSKQWGKWWDQVLIAVCRDEVSEGVYPRYLFKVREGNIVFSQI